MRVKEEYATSVQCSQWGKKKERKSKRVQESVRKKDRGGVENKERKEK